MKIPRPAHRTVLACSLALFAAGCATSPRAARQDPQGDAPAAPAKAPTETAPKSEAAETAELAKKTQNPVSDLISVPFQNNVEFDVGPEEGTRNTLNIQPVVPVGLGEKWKLINRFILPVISQPELTPGGDREFGLGDSTYTAFLSPKDSGSVTWGVGPAFLLPTATGDILGTDKFGIGPSLVVLTQPGPWVVGVLANNIWSVAGEEDAPDVNLLTVQYFVNYNLKSGWYLTTAPILTSNWEAPSDDRWTVPFGGGAGKIVHAGKVPLNVNLQAYSNVEHPDFGPSWSIRLAIALLFPK